MTPSTRPGSSKPSKRRFPALHRPLERLALEIQSVDETKGGENVAGGHEQTGEHQLLDRVRVRTGGC